MDHQPCNGTNPAACTHTIYTDDLLDDIASMDDSNLVRIHDSGQAMGNENHCSAPAMDESMVGKRTHSR